MKSNMPVKVSIITVTYNAVDTIEQTIKSVLEQSYKNIEYIVVDGLSTDGTYEKICKYKNKISKIIHERDDGLYDAMNKGIAFATGQVIGIINGDDWLELDAVASIVDALDDSTDVIYGNLNVWGYGGKCEIGDIVKIDDIWYRMIQHPAVFVTKETYNIHGAFNTAYSIAADYDLMLRFYNERVRFKYLDKILANYRVGGTSYQNGIVSAREVEKIWKKYGDKCPDKARALEAIKANYNSIKIAKACAQSCEKFKAKLDFCFDKNLNDIIIFGAGVWGKRCVAKLRECNVSCNYLVDNSLEKQGTIIDNIEVITPKQLYDMKCNVIVALNIGCDEVCKQLEKIENPNLKWIRMSDLYEEGE